jgi:ATP-binding cassette subfamily B protein
MMDCGPAVLKALLEGHGIRASYGRLREACQTDVDGTSIDTLEEVARDLGLDAEQVMLPADHLLIPEARALPAVAVTVLPGGLSHFVVVWRSHGPRLQVMDPACGRRWPRSRDFVRDLLVHSQPVEAASFREWAETGDYAQPLRQRLRRLGADGPASSEFLREALSTDGWRGPAALDAAVRLAEGLLPGGRGPGTGTRVVRRLFERAAQDGPSPAVPLTFWSVRADPEAEGRLILRGVVLVRVRGRSTARTETTGRSLDGRLAEDILTPEPSRVADVLRLVRLDGLPAVAALVAIPVLAAAAVALEALLLAGVLDLSSRVAVPEQRAGGLLALLAFLALALAIGLRGSEGVRRLGRRMEARLRIAFLVKAPRLGDRFFASRLTADMADRGHAIALLRDLPGALSHTVRSASELLLTATALAWLYPGMGFLAAAVVLLALATPLALQPLLAEHELRARALGAAVSRTYLDALLGLVPIRAHAAEGLLRAQHDALLSRWSDARLAWRRATVLMEAAQAAPAYALAALMVARGAGEAAVGAGTLLLAYWALRLPALSGQLATSLVELPMHRSLLVRLAEPLSAPEEPAGDGAPATASGHGVAIRLEGVSVRAGGHTLLDQVDLDIPAGTHVALIGPSGAGKTTLAGVLLGWHEPAAGSVTADGAPLLGAMRNRVREATAWVEPGVQLWNRSLLDNVRYGSEGRDLGRMLDAAGLDGLMEMLPAGLQTSLGEGGALVSGGEGQRVRLARALGRCRPRLAILDEPFRGLPREERRRLLEEARAAFREATLVFVTHDLDQVEGFDRVVVLDGGRVVEEGVPARLRETAGSAYGRLRAEHEAFRREAWDPGRWRGFHVIDGRVEEDGV